MSVAAKLFHPGAGDSGDIVRDIVLGFYDIAFDAVIEASRAQGYLTRNDVHPDPSLLAAAGARCWMPELGRALELARSGGSVVRNALAQLLLCNAALGMPVDTTVEISSACGLQFAGFRLPCVSKIRITGDGRVVEIAADEAIFKFEILGGFWRCDGSPCALRAGIADPVVAITGGNCLDPAVSAVDDIAISSYDFPVAVREIEATFDLIGRVIPDYVPWTHRLIRQVHVLGDRNGDIKMRGGRSSPKRPGHITTTIRLPIIQQVEQIVHESSHQHFYLLQLLHKIPRYDANEKIFVSPLNGKKRDISRYLLAYHVVANMLMFYRAASEQDGLDQDVIGQRRNYLRPIASEYLATLRENAHLLTEEANTFWQPSSEYVSELCSA